MEMSAATCFLNSSSASLHLLREQIKIVTKINPEKRNVLQVAAHQDNTPH